MKLRRIIALLLALVMAFSLCACKGGTGGKKGATPLVVGYDPFSEKFSPFFADTAYDQDVAGMTQVALLTTDRVGNIIYNGIKGETIAYNGTDYTYTGIADLKVTENDDGTVEYLFKLRDDIKFSDGEPLTADDVIFSMYVLCDPTYDGSSTLYAVPIAGLEEYRSGMDSLFNLIEAAGPDNTDFTYWDEATQKDFFAAYDKANVAMAQEIIDFCVEAGYNTADDSVAAVAANWGYELADDATVEDFAADIVAAYDGSAPAAWATETAGSSFADVMEGFDKYSAGVKTGDSADSITGIEKVDEYTVKVTTTSFDATAIYQFALAVAPMHYYGESDKYDYGKNMFGFTKGDLSHVKSVTTQPMGAGPYKFVKYDNKIVYFEANDGYFKGAPKTANVQFKETATADKTPGVGTGTIDITDPSFSKAAAEEIGTYNSNKEITGDKIVTSLVANLGYGYIGINADTVNVGGKADSDASKNLRKALATVLAVYRDMAVDSYYSEAAEVINYPISTTSWAAPQKSDSDYTVAYSVDVDGNPIYTAQMKAEDKYKAASQAALAFLEKAGYVIKDGKAIAAPAGAKLEYECIIPADGVGDHPSFAILTAAKEAFAKIGINIIINDPADSNELWDKLDAGSQELWCAAWGATIDPDMYQVYHSSNIVGLPGSSESNHYHIQDANLDKYIMDARTSADQSYRKAIYKSCLDIILDWAVEIPVYQRQNCIIYSAERIKDGTMTPDITTFYNWTNEIENVEMA